MYIHRLEGPWLKHPFWRKSFLLTDPDDLEVIRGGEFTAIVIDDEKSLIPAAKAVPPPAAIVPDDPAPVEAPPPAVVEVSRPRAPRMARPQPRLAAAAEIDRAAAVAEKSARTVAQLLAQARLGRAVDIARVIPVVEDIAASVDRNPSALISVTRMRSKDEYTYFHSVAVCALMINLARQLGFAEPQAREAGLAGLLHDFGKVSVPDALLTKPGSLTEVEFGLVRQHVERGHQLLKANGYPEAVADAALHHHERYDGSGYPHGLKGDRISELARMAAVCDVYDAITSRRPYREAAAPAESLASMFRWEGQFDPDILAAFIRSLGIYPVGSLVRLKSNRLALVIDQAENDAMRPLVRVFYCIAGRRRVPASDLDLSAGVEDEAIVSREDPVKWGFTNWDTQWTNVIRAAPAANAA
jgi:putative nucleotidyltransferase with HDIG domain